MLFDTGKSSWVVTERKVVADKHQCTLSLSKKFFFLCYMHIKINLSILSRWISISRNSRSSNRQETWRRIQNAKTNPCGHQIVNEYTMLLNLLWSIALYFWILASWQRRVKTPKNVTRARGSINSQKAKQLVLHLWMYQQSVRKKNNRSEGIRRKQCYERATS